MFLTKLRKKIANYLINKKFKKLKRNARFINIEKARKVAVLYDASDKSNDILIKDMVNFLRENHNRVEAIGYINMKEFDNPMPTLSYSFFCKKDINFFFLPKSQKIKEFINKDFDILVDLCIEEIIPVKYLLFNSVASFKVGLSGIGNDAAYDFMICLKEKNLAKYINELKKYLLKINNSKNYNYV